ncbi:MAG: tryptophan-rich sensory protein [Chloroflexi bacterium]|nr:MAG: tryptophan-rich sensory protein [Chloroflexota bacterium]MBL1194699.1 tryptophan-rich sensory protein [Chloroflexota bacterium]NOH11992.1 tryptophan-rich sensory protein [Chloroflexota bacterium]
MNKITTNQIITIIATLVTITVNGLANAIPFNGQATGEISDRFAIYFVPAGYVFSIWGLIYLSLLAFTVYQAMPAQRDNPLLKKIYPAYWIGSLANSIWVFLWHYEFFPLTLVAMLTILATLLYIYRQISTASGQLDRNQKWFIRFPFSIYLGWISVATIANVSQVLFFTNWGGWGISGPTWAVIMLAVAALLGLLMLWRERDIPYALVLIWAFVGIAVSQADTALVANSAWVTTGVLVILGAVIFFNRNKASQVTA